MFTKNFPRILHLGGIVFLTSCLVFSVIHLPLNLALCAGNNDHIQLELLLQDSYAHTHCLETILPSHPNIQPGRITAVNSRDNCIACIDTPVLASHMVFYRFNGVPKPPQFSFHAILNPVNPFLNPQIFSTLSAPQRPVQSLGILSTVVLLN